MSRQTAVTSRELAASSAADGETWTSARSHGIARELIAGYAGVLVLMALAGAVAAAGTGVLQDRFTHTVQTVDALQNDVTLRSKLMDDAETGSRGYLLTASRDFLEPYVQARRALPALRAQTTALSAGEPGVRPLLATMSRRALAWEAWVRRLLGRPLTQARADVAAQREGKALFDAYRAATNGVLGYLAAARQRSLQDAQTTAGLVRALVLALFCGALVLALVLIVLSVRAVTRPLAGLRQAAAAIGRGEVDQPVEARGAREFVLVAQSMDQMRRQLASQQRLARIVGSTLRVDEIYAPFAAGVRVLVPFDRLTITMIEEGTGTLIISYATGAATEALGAGLRVPLERIYPHDEHRAGLPLVWEDLAALSAKERRPYLDDLLAQGIRAVVAVPLMSQGQVVGMLSLSRMVPRAFDAGTVAMLVTLAQPLASAMANARLYEEVACTNAELARASRIKSEFLATMSHELRTPLNAIIGFSEVLHDETFGPLNPRQQRYVGNVLESGRHLLGLINDVLDLSKVEAGRMELHPEDLALPALLAEVRDHMLPLAQKKGVELHLVAAHEAAGAVVRADRARLVQILYNLLSNAIKFTPADGTVSVRWMVQPETVAIAVADTGIGIAPEDQQRIFEEFAQVDSSVGRQQQGTGLGLALTRRLVELHGGTLSLQSALGQGSTFTVVLPRVPEVSPEAPTQSMQGDVLVVEDDQMAYELLSVSLAEAGYQAHWVRRVAEVVPRAREVRPVAITLDILLQEETGQPVLEQLRADPQTRDIPVVIVSILDEQATGFALGASAYLVKPVARPELLSTLARVVNGGPGGPDGRRRVLAVDDQPEALELIALALEGTHYELLLASSGAQALDILAREHPDLLLIDLEMAPLSGFDVIEAVVSTQRTRDLPIIALTARELTAEDRARLNGHVAATLSKSGFDKGRFLRELRRATHRNHTEGAGDEGS